MSAKMKLAIYYLVIQVALDMLICIVAGIVTVVYWSLFHSEFDYGILLWAPILYAMFVFSRYVTLGEVFPRLVLYYLLRGESSFRIWKAFIIASLSYVWIIFLLQSAHGWNQGESWIFPFDNDGGMMAIYLVFMFISTLLSPFVMSRLRIYRIQSRQLLDKN